MTESRVLLLILLLIAVNVLWFVIMLYYRKWSREVFRQRMFAERDSWFIYAAENDLFENEGYIFLRSHYNGLLKFAGRISFFSMLYYIFLLPKPIQKSLTESYDSALSKAENDLSHEDHNEFKERFERISDLRASQILRASPCSGTLIILLAFVTGGSFLAGWGIYQLWNLGVSYIDNVFNEDREKLIGAIAHGAIS